MSAEFTPIANRIVDALLEADPTLAYEAGDHRFDELLPDYSPGAVADRVPMLREAAHVLSQVDEDELAPEERVDHAMLGNAVDAELFELTEVRSHEWDPLRYNPGNLLYGLLARDFAPLPERMRAVVARLTALPDVLATARVVLTDCPAVHVETAIGQFTGTAALIRDELSRMLADTPDLARQVEPAQRQAVAAVQEFVDWLRARQGQPGRDPRLGRLVWEAKLWHTLDTELTAAEVLRRAYDNLDRLTAELREAAAKLDGGTADDAGVRRALGRLAEQHPDNGTIVRLAEVALDETTAFVRDHELVSLVPDPCVIQEMPEFARGVAVAYCEAPGPLETVDLPTFYAISPTPADWPADRVESFYREYNDHMMRNMTVHEAMPGHFLQLAHARRYTGSSRVRAAWASGTFTEGWAVYAEEMMVEYGFGGLPVRMQQLKTQLRSTINAILDQLVHCENLSEPDGMALMVERGYQEEGEAAGKWRRALMTSTQLSTYFVGYTEVAAIAADRPEGINLRDWHDSMLAHGSPAPRHLRSLLLG